MQRAREVRKGTARVAEAWGRGERRVQDLVRWGWDAELWDPGSRLWDPGCGEGRAIGGGVRGGSKILAGLCGSGNVCGPWCSSSSRSFYGTPFLLLPDPNHPVKPDLVQHSLS